MADVLLIHAKEDEVLVQGLVDSLARSGVSVGLSPTSEEPDPACALVVWSPASVRSGPVRDAAIHAQREGKLVSVKLAGCEPPLGFSRPAPHDLSAWTGDPEAPLLDTVFFAIDRLVCGARLAPQASNQRQPLVPATPPPRAAPTPAPAAPAMVAAPPPLDLRPQLEPAEAAWRQIEQSNDPLVFRAYLRQFGRHSRYSGAAQIKIETLTKPRPAPQPTQRPAPPPVADVVPDPDLPGWARAKARTRVVEDEEFSGPLQLDETTTAQTASEAEPEADDFIEPEYPAEAPVQPQAPSRLSMLNLPWRPLLIVSAIVLGGLLIHKLTPGQTLSPEMQLAGVPAPPPGIETAIDLNALPTAPSLPPAAVTPLPAPRAPLVPPAVRPRPAPPVTSDAASPPPSAAPAASSSPISFAPPVQPEAPQPAVSVAPQPAPPSAAPSAAPRADDNYVTVIWLQRPSSNDLANLFPAQAANRGISGSAVLDCAVLATGRLSCVIASESPGGYGFGRAALAMASRFQASATAQDGRSALGRRTRVPIRFALAPDANR